MKTYVYVDEFNLYYGALKDSKFRWLNIEELCKRALPDNNIVKVKYYTARVKDRDHNPGQAGRQELYLRALRSLPNTEIIYGRFSSHWVSMYSKKSKPKKPHYEEVYKTEEKGSDVNIATDLMGDGCSSAYDIAVIISNDSDLERTVQRARSQYGLTVGVVNPNIGRHASHALARQASFVKPIRRWHLEESQFPTVIRVGEKRISKPHEWR